MTRKNAQLAVETLLIYGVALLIVMAAIGALISFGVLDIGNMLPEKCSVSSGFSCENFVGTQDGVQFEFLNTAGQNIDMMNVSVVGTGNNEGLWDCEDPADPTLDYAFYSRQVLNGEVTSPPVQLRCNIGVSSGKRIQGDIMIKYRPTGSAIWRTTTGTISASVS